MNKNKWMSPQLDKPISIKSLISEDQQFDIVGNLEEAYENFTIQDDIIDADDDDENSEQFILESGFKFSEMKISMEAVSEYIHKVIKSPGTGETVPSIARVTVEYTVYLEGDIKPFDTSFLKQEKFVVVLGSDSHYFGFQEAIRTMKKNEVAVFIISCKLLWGPDGYYDVAKPMAPNTDALYNIKLLDFAEIGDSTAIDKMTPGEKMQFCILSVEAQKVMDNAKDNFKLGYTNRAIRLFHDIITSLELSTTANDAEVSAQTDLLYQIYRNLTVCYNRVSKPQKVCEMVKAMNKLKSTSEDSKSLFQEGRALMNLGEYDKAKQVLQTAFKLNPDKLIAKELSTLEKKNKEYKNNIGNIWQKALQNKENIERVVKVSEEPKKKCYDEFEIFIFKFIEVFKRSNDTVRKLPDLQLTIDNIHSIEDLVADMTDIGFRESHVPLTFEFFRK